MFERGTALQSWKAKAEFSAINFIHYSFISPSDEEDANEEVNVLENERDEEIIMQICSFFNRLSCVKEKSYTNNTSNL